jgi:hypothetical protein
VNNLQSALSKAGLVSEKQVCETSAEAQLHQEMEAARLAKPVKEKEKRMGILAETVAPALFRREARKLLLLYPDAGQAQDIINLAHAQGMKEKKAKGGAWLIANLYQVKEALQQSGLSDEAKKAIVDKKFSNK